MFQSKDPFFSNDLMGGLKLLGSLGALGAVIIGVFVRWGQSKFTEDVKDMKHRQGELEDALKSLAPVKDLNQLGERVNEIDRGCIEQTTNLRTLTTRVDRQEVMLQQIIASQGEQKAGITLLQNQGTALQHEMTMMIMESGARIQNLVQELALKVERLDASKGERDRMGLILERLLNQRDGKAG